MKNYNFEFGGHFEKNCQNFFFTFFSLYYMRNWKIYKFQHIHWFDRMAGKWSKLLFCVLWSRFFKLSFAYIWKISKTCKLSSLHPMGNKKKLLYSQVWEYGREMAKMPLCIFWLRIFLLISWFHVEKWK